MALISLRQLLDHAAERGYGVPAFNISNMEQSLAVLRAAASVDAPVILQASLNARRNYAGDIMLVGIVEALTRMFPSIPICFHQDHGPDEVACISAIQNGFTSVMMDGSLERDARTPASYAYNVRITEAVTRVAHWAGVSVEGELGVLGRLETGESDTEDGVGAAGHLDHSQMLTDPDQAVDFVARTKVDALAVACGTSHGAYKFSRKPDGDILSLKTIENIHARLPDTHLVMHGSSSVPENLQKLINDNGGEMPETWGVPIDEILRGIRHGVRKINIDTDCRMAMSGQFRKFARENPAEIDPRKFLSAGMAEMTKVCRERFEQFGAAGNAAAIKPIPLEVMTTRYAEGSLDPRTSPALAMA